MARINSSANDKKDDWPEKNALAVAKIKKVEKYDAKAVLVDYSYNRVFIHISEIANEHVENINNYVSKDDVVVVKYTGIRKIEKKGKKPIIQHQASLKQVNEEDKKKTFLSCKNDSLRHKFKIKYNIQYLDENKFYNFDNIDMYDICGFSYELGKSFVKSENDLKVTQLRRFFDDLRLIETKDNWELIKPKFHLFKVQLEISLNRNSIPQLFYNLMIKCLSQIETSKEKEENFKIFVRFVESIVAYHKFHTFLSENKSYSEDIFDEESFEIHPLVTIYELNDLIDDEECGELEYANSIARRFLKSKNPKNNLNINQLRKIFNALKNIELYSNNKLTDFYRLKPQISYSFGRGLIPYDFYRLLMFLMDLVYYDNLSNENDNWEKEFINNLKILIKLLESVIAYGKFIEVIDILN
ncbi:type III-A CRISPR-associated protein Csm2 [Methanobrevibacter curvatus]|uniref:CRISPR system Cms protein Csm2 n=1 Tax=Methanobrevibacter curvatus TaxID=49547 RepID=A0A166ANN0_9EURY|nr:type III-A CRISPR-associated protein Csm2 [Methanobrevibacter curvatus]KZX12272.1 translation initiation factor IF-2 subunit alpha [Methanobrevibacter curvatus]